MSRIQLALCYIQYKIRAKNKHAIHSPFVFNLLTTVIAEKREYYAYNDLAELRSELSQSSQTIEIKDFGAGSKVFKTKTRKIKDIVKHGISPEKYARLLFRLVNYFNPETVIELGTSIGLTTLYLAKANSNIRVYTLEGCNQTVNFEKQLFKSKYFENIKIIEGEFSYTLPQLLTKIQKIDFVYIDGNHRKQATIDYFNLLIPYRHNDTVLIFDDIKHIIKNTKGIFFCKRDLNNFLDKIDYILNDYRFIQKQIIKNSLPQKNIFIRQLRNILN